MYWLFIAFHANHTTLYLLKLRRVSCLFGLFVCFFFTNSHCPLNMPGDKTSFATRFLLEVPVWFHLLGAKMKQSHRQFSVSVKWSGTELKHAALLSPLTAWKCRFQSSSPGSRLLTAPMSTVKKNLSMQTYALKVPEDGDLMIHHRWSYSNDPIMQFPTELIESLFTLLMVLLSVVPPSPPLPVGHLINHLDSFDVTTSSIFRNRALNLTVWEDVDFSRLVESETKWIADDSNW